MTSLTSALRIGTSGLQLSQVALSTVSHNIVNANTAGYSRQIVQLGSVAQGGYGNGVQLNDIQRVTDNFLVARQLGATADTSYATTKSSYLTSIQNYFSGSGASGGLDKVAGNFISSFSQLSDDPSNTALRRNVVQQAALVAENIRTTYTSLQETANNADTAINSELATCNQLLKDISSLNAQIGALTNDAGAGANANDLMDARATKIDELAQRFKIQVSQTANNAVRITTENGRKLVDEASYVQFTRTGTDNKGIGIQAVKVDGTLDTTIFPLNTDTLTTGKVKALIYVRDEAVPDLESQLNQFTSVFTTAVNDISSQGSSFPPVNSLSSGNTSVLADANTDLYTGLSSTLAGTTFKISVVDSHGDPVTTAMGGATLTLPGAGPFSLNDLANLINTDTTIGNTALGGTQGVIASVTNDASGKPYLTIQTANSNNRIVLANGTGDVLGALGMNNIFTGSTANTVAVKSSLSTNPDLLPVARMRTTDGGLSSQDNQNIIALAQLADTPLTFGAAGGLGAQTTTAVGYTGQILSNLAVKVADAADRQTFNENVSNQLDGLASSVSGVNINEELSNMLVYQNSFQASSRIITVVNQLLEDLINTIR